MWKHNNRSVILLIVCLVTYGSSTPINREDLNEILADLKNEIRKEFRQELAQEKADFTKKHQCKDIFLNYFARGKSLLELWVTTFLPD